jgi:hypothetical protein
MSNWENQVSDPTDKYLMQKSLQEGLLIERNNQETHPPKMMKAKYFLLSLVLSLIIGSIPFFAAELGLTLGWLKLIQLLLFLGIGFLCFSKLAQEYFLEDIPGVALKNAAQLSVLILIALAVLYYFIDSKFLLLALGSAAAFMVAHVISSAWFAFIGIAETGYGVWSKPIPDIREKTFIFFGGIPVKIIFSVERNDKHKKVFRSHAPLDKTIGDFFNHFVLIQRNNNKIEIDLLDEEQLPFGWKFYKVDFGGFRKNQLDPDMTFEESKLKNHTTIKVQRVRLSEINNDQV